MKTEIDPSAAPVAPPDAAAQPNRPIRVLLVEDSALVRHRIRTMLEEMGAVEIVGEVGTIAAAQMLFRTQRPEAVLLDLRLADGPAHALLREIKALDPGCLVVVLSGFLDDDSRAWCLETGADYCFDKSTEFECAAAVLAHRSLPRTPAQVSSPETSSAATRHDIDHATALLVLSREELAHRDGLLAVLQRITATSAQVLGIERVSVWRRNAAGDGIQCIDLFERGTGAHTAGQELRAENSPAYFAALADSEIIDANDAVNDPRTCEFAEGYLRLLGIGAMLDVPIRVHGEVIGVVCHEHVGGPRAWTPDEMAFAVAIGNLAAHAFEEDERGRTEARLALQDAALQAAANAIVITDPHGTIVWVNPAFTALTGYSAEEVLGRKPSILKSSEQPREYYTDLWRTIRRGDVWRGQLRNRRKDGSLYDEEMTITPVKNAAGRATHYIAIKEDVSAKKQLEAQLLRSQRMESLGALAGGIAHDLNNALAPILISCELLRMKANDAETTNILNVMDTSAQRGAAMVRQILTFARGSDGSCGLVQLRHLVREMGGIAQQTFSKCIQIHTEIGEGIWAVAGNPTQLHQVILNLCVNARDAMPEGGTLTLAVDNVRVDETFAAMTPGARPGAYVRIAVRDTGTGMTPEVRARVFEPFFTTKDGEEGTGLGLATVQRIVREHGGFLTLQSEEGHGTEFQIHLPAQESAEAEAEVSRPAPPMGHGELILVVDDEASIVNIAAQTLELCGYRVLTAGDGAQALVVLAQHAAEVQLVLCDLAMPVLDGAAAIHAMRRMSPQVKIIASSGQSPLSLRAAETSLNDYPHLPKPYRADELLEAVHRALHAEPAAVG